MTPSHAPAAPGDPDSPGDAELMRLFGGLPRAGPGHDDVTRAVLERLPRLPTDPVVLDLGRAIRDTLG